MPSRRAHAKTRHGCRQCKVRRVKCDLQRPLCGNCDRRNENCGFLLEAQSWTPPTTVSSASSPPVAKDAPVSLNLLDLELLHHYTTIVYATLCLDSAATKMWQVDVPKEAFVHPYLMHCILATSALELFITSSAPGNDMYLNAGIRHHNAALSGYRLLLNNVNKDNCDALGASSALLAVISAVMCHPLCQPEPKSPIENIVEVSALIKGVSVIVSAGGQFIRQGKLAPLLNRTPWDDPPQLPQDVHFALDGIKSKIASSYADGRGAIYLAAHDSLRQTFEAVEVNQEHPPLFFYWLVVVSRDYIDMLKENDPMALVILAHFSVICQGSSQLWWARNWDQIILDAVSQALDDEWRQLIAWPIQKFEARLQNSTRVGSGSENHKGP